MATNIFLKENDFYDNKIGACTRNHHRSLRAVKCRENTEDQDPAWQRFSGSIYNEFPTETSLKISLSVMQIESIFASLSPMDTKECGIVLSI
jgi:hypothetical protein